MVATRLGPGGTKNLLRREAGLKPKPSLPTAPRPTTPLAGRPGMGATGPRGASRAMQRLHGPEARAIYDNARENGKSISQAKAAVNRALRKGDIISKPQKGTLSLKTGGTPKGNVMKGGLSRAPKRLATKFLGKAGMKAVKGVFGKIPILGPIVVAVASLLAGEPIGQALFKAVGAAVGGFLGTFIPIPSSVRCWVKPWEHLLVIYSIHLYLVVVQKKQERNYPKQLRLPLMLGTNC